MASPPAREILNNALKRREELRLESEALDNLITTYQNILGIGNPLRETYEEQPDLYRSMSKRAQRSAQVAEMVDAARRIIIAEARPMKRGELVKRPVAVRKVRPGRWQRLLAKGRFTPIGVPKSQVVSPALGRVPGCDAVLRGVALRAGAHSLRLS